MKLTEHIKKNETLQYYPVLPTLKATLFLLYYNLIESIMNSAFQLLFDTISSEGHSFDTLSHKVQKAYENLELKNSVGSEQILKWVSEKYSTSVKLFSGNLDARAIRELMEKWDIATDFHTDGEKNLLVIKTHRNALAHGERAFNDVGRGYTMRDMEQYLESTHAYLSNLIQTFNLFIESKSYLAH